MPKFCECGCGEIVKKGNRFINGHNARGKEGFWTNKKFSKKHRKNMSLASAGKKKSKRHCLNMSESAKIAQNRPEVIEKIRKLNTGQKRSSKTRKKLRIAKLESIEKNYGIPYPNYTPSACEIFKVFDKKNKTQGRYAVYGNGEYRVPRLYYSLDYINFDLKLIIEVDEKHHFDKSTGLLKEKDIIRQKEIQEKFPDFKFLRFKDTEIYKILEIKI